MDNYIDLRFAVSDLVSNRIMSDVFPRLVKAAEVRFNQQFRTVWQVQDETLYFDEGQAQLPFDFLEVLHLYGINDRQMRAGMPATTKRCGSEYSTYSIGNGTITLRGYTGERDLQYYAQIPTLTSSPTACNWLLQRYPNTYLYGVGLEAAKFLRDAEQAVVIDGLLASEMQAVRIDDERTRWSNSVVRVQGLTP